MIDELCKVEIFKEWVMRTAKLFLFGLLTALVGCGEEAKPVHVADHSSPEAVFAAYCRTQEKRDWKTFYETLSPGEKDKQILNFVSAILSVKSGEIATFIVKYTDKKRAAALKESTDMNKLSVEEQSRLFASCITNKKRMFVEINLICDEQDIERFTWSALRNVVRHQRRAKGVASLTYVFKWSAKKKTGGPSVTHREKREIEQPVYFIKHDGKWLFATQQEWENAN